MRRFNLHHLALVVLLIFVLSLSFAGCQSLEIGQTATTPAVNAVNAVARSTTPTPPLANADGSAGQSTATKETKTTVTVPASTADATTAIKAVIQQANEAQQEAFTKDDPTIMKNTASADYYEEMAQVNDDMAAAGVTSIKLLRIEWGAINIRSEINAEATTYETWLTTYSDGTTEQTRNQNNYTLVVEQGTWKIQSDVQPQTASMPGGQSSQSPSTPSSPSSPGQTTQPTSVDGSPNWSGYAATEGKFTAVSGTWTIPEPDITTTTNGASATWVGIGGVSTDDLIQAGTMETTDGQGGIVYQAWIEMLPASMQTVNLTVTPGDSITVSISEKKTNTWLITIRNNTTGKSYEKTVNYTSSHSSAEWVEEAPSASRGIVPLADFGNVEFSGGTTVVNGKTLTISQSGAEPINMLNSQDEVIASPSSLNADGTGFTVTRSDASSTTQFMPGSRGRYPSPVGPR